MKLTKGWKVTLGISTFLVTAIPFVLAFLLFIPLVLGAGSLKESPEPLFSLFVIVFPLFFLCIFLLAFLNLGLMIFYLAHIVKNKDGSEILRILLGVGVQFLPFIAMPAYFLIYVWPDKVPEWALEINAKRR